MRRVRVDEQSTWPSSPNGLSPFPFYDLSHPLDKMLVATAFLSFLPTEKAIAATILSSRWKLLWNTPPPRSYIRIQKLVLALRVRIAPFLQKAILVVSCDTFLLDIWTHTSIPRNFQQLHLQIYLNGDHEDFLCWITFRVLDWCLFLFSFFFLQIEM